MKPVATAMALVTTLAHDDCAAGVELLDELSPVEMRDLALHLAALCIGALTSLGNVLSLDLPTVVARVGPQLAQRYPEEDR